MGLFIIIFVGGVSIAIIGSLINKLLEIDSFWHGYTMIIYMLVSLFTLIIIDENIETKDVPFNEVSITALKDGNVSEGTFFLGSGSVDGVTYYYYMVDTQYGKTMNKIKAANTYIQEGDFEPKIVKYKEDYDSKFWNWVYPNHESRTIIQVPENTVTKDFEIDME